MVYEMEAGQEKQLTMAGLNPCFCGRWFMSNDAAVKVRSKSVLILVFVEDGL